MEPQMEPKLSYKDLRKQLDSLEFPIHAPPPAAPNKAFTASISELQLHPTLEAALHLLNADLASAHFLVRHMQGLPAVEGMALHGMLHRIEGDFDNNRAWLRDCFDAARGRIKGAKLEGQTEEEREEVGRFLLFVWGYPLHLRRNEEVECGLEDARKRALVLTDEVEALRKKREGEENELSAKCKEELERVLEWCEGKFGTERVVDATSAWAKPMEHVKEIGEDQVSGGKGWREF